jgi:hypothetical protein
LKHSVLQLLDKFELDLLQRLSDDKGGFRGKFFAPQRRRHW